MRLVTMVVQVDGRKHARWRLCRACAASREIALSAFYRPRR